MACDRDGMRTRRIAAERQFRRRGAPTPGIEPCPKAKPPPGNPTWPSIEASVIAIQYGGSPRCARCSDQVSVSIERTPSSWRASARMSAAGTPQIASAHSGDFASPSLRPVR